MQPTKLYVWTARRAGAAITIEGNDANERPLKITGIVRIQPKNGRIVAVRDDGHEWELSN